jgi:uncharacterized membrane protein
MVGAFLAFGVDTVVIVAALWYVGRLSGAVAGGLSAAVVGLFLLWVAGRWVRLRRRGGTDPGEGVEASSDGTAIEVDPVERVKRRYADGELSEAEFERRLDGLLDAEDRAGEAEPPPGSTGGRTKRRREQE